MTTPPAARPLLALIRPQRRSVAAVEPADHGAEMALEMTYGAGHGLASGPAPAPLRTLHWWQRLAIRRAAP